MRSRAARAPATSSSASASCSRRPTMRRSRSTPRSGRGSKPSFRPAFATGQGPESGSRRRCRRSRWRTAPEDNSLPPSSRCTATMRNSSLPAVSHVASACAVRHDSALTFAKRAQRFSDRMTRLKWPAIPARSALLSAGMATSGSPSPDGLAHRQAAAFVHPGEILREEYLKPLNLAAASYSYRPPFTVQSSCSRPAGHGTGAPHSKRQRVWNDPTPCRSARAIRPR